MCLHICILTMSALTRPTLGVDQVAPVHRASPDRRDCRAHGPERPARYGACRAEDPNRAHDVPVEADEHRERRSPKGPAALHLSARTAEFETPSRPERPRQLIKTFVYGRRGQKACLDQEREGRGQATDSSSAFSRRRVVRMPSRFTSGRRRVVRAPVKIRPNTVAPVTLRSRHSSVTSVPPSGVGANR